MDIMSNDKITEIISQRIIIPPHRFQHPSHWHYQLQEIKKYNSEAASNGIASIPNSTKIHSAILELAEQRMNNLYDQ
jgi:hypothetical protein